MKKQHLVFAALVTTALGVSAQSVSHTTYARVVSVKPLISEVKVETPVDCDIVRSESTGTGAVIGAVVGGVVGNRFGGGTGRAAATAAGVIGGAVIGDQLEKGSGAERCVASKTYIEERLDGFEVFYEYAGMQGRVFMKEAPGHEIPVTVRVTPSVAEQVYRR